jgi:hypothetical protein
MLSKEACEDKEKHPAYFTYLLAHEFGHAHICLTDLELHILTCLIDMFIKDASDDTITMDHQTPHERCYDQFGIYVAERLFTREQLNIEIEELLKDTNREDHTRLENMLSLPALYKFGDLRQESIDLVRLYKEEFMRLCQQHIVKKNGHSIATELTNLADLLE